MSGYVALVRFDGAPIDSAFVDSLADSIRFRGPDGEGKWIGEQAALVHSLLATNGTARQPVRLGETMIAGDIRIDDRDPADRTTDAEVVLQAYAKWGEAFVEHLIGDFSFALWDGAQRKLVCARDRFARRPLFYAQYEGALLVTNNLPTLLDLPGLADELDDAAVADFLLFGRNFHPQRTTFARISRAPAAHLLIATAQSSQLRRYWTIPMRDQPRRISEDDAQAEFRDVFTKAVMDRARADRIVISLSGGLDSNAVAATLTRQRTAGVSALTTVWNEMFDDEEGRYAKIAADAYGIPIEYHVADQCEAFEDWDDPRVRGLEPTDEPCTALFHRFVAKAASKTRVIFTGEGGDPALYASHDHFFNLLKRMRLVRFVRDAAGYALTRRERPPLILRSRVMRALGRRPPVLDYPPWMTAEHRARWEEVNEPSALPRHPYRAGAWSFVDSATWARTFEATDAGASGQPLEWSSPYFDVRVIEYLFSLPPMPHFANKDIVRQSLKGWMPEEVRLRRKTPLPVDPSARRFSETSETWAKTLESAAELDRWIDRPVLCEAIRRGGSQYHASQQAFGVSLALWIRKRQELPGALTRRPG